MIPTYWAGIPVPFWIALGLIMVAWGFESSRRARARAKCREEGHQWISPGMGDDPNYSIICNRCEETPR